MSQELQENREVMEFISTIREMSVNVKDIVVRLSVLEKNISLIYRKLHTDKKVVESDDEKEITSTERRNISKHFKEFRRKHSLSQKKLGELLDRDASFVGAVERRQRRISYKLYNELCGFLNNYDVQPKKTTSTIEEELNKLQQNGKIVGIDANQKTSSVQKISNIKTMSDFEQLSHIKKSSGYTDETLAKLIDSGMTGGYICSFRRGLVSPTGKNYKIVTEWIKKHLYQYR